jgi:hypothetical protein
MHKWQPQMRLYTTINLMAPLSNRIAQREFPSPAGTGTGAREERAEL